MDNLQEKEIINNKSNSTKKGKKTSVKKNEPQEIIIDEVVDFKTLEKKETISKEEEEKEQEVEYESETITYSPLNTPVLDLNNDTDTILYPAKPEDDLVDLIEFTAAKAFILKRNS